MRYELNIYMTTVQQLVSGTIPVPPNGVLPSRQRCARSLPLTQPLAPPKDPLPTRALGVLPSPFTSRELYQRSVLKPGHDFKIW